MPELKVYSNLGRGSEFVHTSTRNDAPCVLFVPHMELDGHRIRTETPSFKKWKEAGFPGGEFEEEDDAQPTLGIGEGFMILTIKHADDESWAYLSTLPDDAYGEGSTREHFEVLLTHFEYIPLEPEDGSPWIKPDPRSNLDRSDG
ncbi:MAG TPA: hypothetical protein VLA89_10230 [Gemmatimonadales bacterium]|nr:hypothetical protein [Gemmatimonadales bacterium]